ncbi:MAG: protein-disulfide reductase DsbD domain-containing protein [Flavisolibacter sp.]
MKIFLLVILLPALSASAQSKLDIKVQEAANHLTCLPPNESNPVTINVQAVNEGDSMAVIVKASMAPGWHIYAYVPSTQPYITIEQILHLPENIKAVGQWQKTEPEASSDEPGVLIYEDEAVFIHKAVKLSPTKTRGVIKAGLYYQTCNLRQCLPPKEKIFELSQ